MRFATITMLGLAGTALALPKNLKIREHLPVQTISEETKTTLTPSSSSSQLMAMPSGVKDTTVAEPSSEKEYYKLLEELENNIAEDNKVVTGQAAAEDRLEKLRDDFIDFELAEDAWWSSSIAHETPAPGREGGMHGGPKIGGSPVHGHHSSVPKHGGPHVAASISEESIIPVKATPTAAYTVGSHRGSENYGTGVFKGGPEETSSEHKGTGIIESGPGETPSEHKGTGIIKGGPEETPSAPITKIGTTVEV